MLQDQLRRDRNPGVLGAGHDLERLERCSSQVEEVIMNADWPVLEHVRPDLGQLGLNRAVWRVDVGGLVDSGPIVPA